MRSEHFVCFVQPFLVWKDNSSMKCVANILFVLCSLFSTAVWKDNSSMKYVASTTFGLLCAAFFPRPFERRPIERNTVPWHTKARIDREGQRRMNNVGLLANAFACKHWFEQVGREVIWLRNRASLKFPIFIIRYWYSKFRFCSSFLLQIIFYDPIHRIRPLFFYMVI